MSNLINDVPVIIIIQMNVLEETYRCIIGNPTDVLGDETSGAGAGSSNDSLAKQTE